MKLSEAREHYYSHSGSASNAARQIAFAGIAVAWVFNRPHDGAPINLPVLMLVALLLCALSLLLDLLQYSTSALIWGYYSRRIEKRHHTNVDPQMEAREPEFEAPAWFNLPGNIFFWGKLAVLACAYGALLDSLRHSLGWG